MFIKTGHVIYYFKEEPKRILMMYGFYVKHFSFKMKYNLAERVFMVKNF